MDKTLSCILLVYKEPEKLRHCVDRLLKLTDVDFEVIIVDNGAEKDIKEFIHSIKDERVKLLSNEDNMGISTGLNQGIKEAKGKYIAYINSDYYVTDNWASQMIKCIEETKAGLIGPMTTATGNRHQFAENIFELPLKYFETHCITVLMFFPKSIWTEVGGFDEEYNPYSWDDLDFAELVKSKGYKIFIDGWTWVVHDYDISKEYDRNSIMERNETYFKNKWGQEVMKQYDFWEK